MRPRARARDSDTQRRALRMGPNSARCSVEAGRRFRHPKPERQDRAGEGAILSESGSRTTAVTLPLLRTAVSGRFGYGFVRDHLTYRDFALTIMREGHHFPHKSALARSPRSDPRRREPEGRQVALTWGFSAVAHGHDPVAVADPHRPARVMGDERGQGLGPGPQHGVEAVPGQHRLPAFGPVEQGAVVLLDGGGEDVDPVVDEDLGVGAEAVLEVVADVVGGGHPARHQVVLLEPGDLLHRIEREVEGGTRQGAGSEHPAQRHQGGQPGGGDHAPSLAVDGPHAGESAGQDRCDEEGGHRDVARRQQGGRAEQAP